METRIALVRSTFSVEQRLKGKMWQRWTPVTSYEFPRHGAALFCFFLSKYFKELKPAKGARRWLATHEAVAIAVAMLERDALGFIRLTILSDTLNEFSAGAAVL